MDGTPHAPAGILASVGRPFTAGCGASTVTISEPWKGVRIRRATHISLPGVQHWPSALQVDGGSEFAAEFELACQQKQLPLFVLPPKSPKPNAHVERSHRTHHEEVYQVHADSDQPPRLNHQLRHWEHIYNCVRPHQSLAYLTPLEFVTR